MATGKLSKQEIAAGLKKLHGWSVVKGNLRHEFEFKDFTQAFGFMTHGRSCRRENGSSS